MPTAPAMKLLKIRPKWTRTRRALPELRGQTLSGSWIPPGLSAELDRQRAELDRLCELAAADLTAREQLEAGFRREDAEHAASLQQAFSTGDDVEDQRTSPQDREAARDGLQEKLETAVLVLAHDAQSVVQTLREEEPAILADLRGRLNESTEKRREAERLLAQARAAEFAVHKTGQWVLNEALDGPLARQPRPDPTATPPPTFSKALLESSLERPWWKPLPDPEPEQVWSGGDGAVPQPRPAEKALS